MAEPIAASWERGGAYGGKPGKGRRLKLQAGIGAEPKAASRDVGGVSGCTPKKWIGEWRQIQRKSPLKRLVR